MSGETPRGRRRPATAGVSVPADRRFRRADAPPVRRRRTSVAWAVGRIAVVVGLVVAVGVWGGRQLAASDMFLVQEITVRGNQRLSAGEVEGLLTGLHDENIFDVDLDAYRERIETSSWVEHVALSRVLPSTVVIEVVERTPVVVARVNQQLYLVDGTGTIVDEYRAEHHDFDLPVVDGLLEPASGESQMTDTERMEAVVLLLDAVALRPSLARRVSQVDVTNPRDLVVMFDDDPAWLHLGEGEFVDRLQRYLDLRPALRDRFGAIDYVDLKFDERVYVRGQGRQTTGSGTTK